MKKRTFSGLLSLALTLALVLGSVSSVFAAWGLPAAVDIKVDGGAAVTLRGYTVEGYDFYALRDIAFLLKDSQKPFDIEVSDSGEITLKEGVPYHDPSHLLYDKEEVLENTASFTTQSYILVSGDGSERKITFSIAKVENRIFMRLGDVLQIFDIFGVYDHDENAVTVDTSRGFTTDFENIAAQGFFDFLHGAAVGDISGDTYYSVNAETPTAIASTTKIMTYLLVMEAVDNPANSITLKDPVPVTAEAARLSRTEDRVLKDLIIGDTIPLEELLDVMMVVSSNEAATMLGEYVAGNEAAFVTRMNEKAAAMELNTARFYNPHGLPVYTQDLLSSKLQNTMSAADLLKLSSYVLSTYPQLIDITSKTTVQVNSAGGYEYTGSTTNRLIYQIDGVDGLKTGTTNRAGACFVATMQADPDDPESPRYVSVVLGAEDNLERYWKAGILLLYAKEVNEADQEK